MKELTQEIKMVDLYGQYDRIKDEIDEAINGVIKKTSFINGPDVKEFSNELAEYIGVKHVIPCGNGTDALQLALMALGLKEGDKVITPSFTYVATAEVIAILGLKPVFVDINPETFNIDISSIKNNIDEKTKAIIPVHLFGQCANMEEILKVAKEHNIKVIEDAAQALGTEYIYENGTKKKTGNIGDIGCTSFFPSKNLGCFGDGGAVFTNNDEYANIIKCKAEHGQTKKYQFDMIGMNSRLDTIQAAVLRVKLKYLNDSIYKRKEVAAYYDKNLNETGLQLPSRTDHSTHTFNQYTIRVCNDQRDNLREFLSEKGIPSVVYYPIPLHLQKAYTFCGYKKGDLLNSESACNEVMSLPLHTEMNKNQQDYIINCINNFFN
ncbi:MAG: DegT/DnrJ/EryC1/StrS family aminotransferase [Flavobacteriales bacterium]